MKKLLLGLFIAIAFMSCKGEDGRDGKDGKDGFVNFKSALITVKESDWQLEGTPGAANSYYYYDYDIAELNDNVYDNGAVVSYMFDPSNADIKRNMPFVLHCGDESTPMNTWTQTYSMEYWPNGGVRFTVTYSDFVDANPGEESFYVTLMWN